jgi:hypothetical protein
MVPRGDLLLVVLGPCKQAVQAEDGTNGEQ